jgi:hypothetical protein
VTASTVHSTASAVLVLSLLAAGAAADPLPTSEPPQQPGSRSTNAALDTITIEAARERELLEQRISTFVSSITIRSWSESLARWQVPICALVAGLPRAEALSLYGRVLQVAGDAGIPLHPEVACTPNFLVVVTPEPEELIRKWWHQNPRLFNTERGVGLIERTIRTDQPVRVFYNACFVPPGTAKSFALKGDPLCGSGTLGSRLEWEAVRVIYSAALFVDSGYTKDVKIGQLADYIAMIGLAQIRRNSELRDAPTILRLFADSDAAKPQGLSPWDQLFLKSLYATNASSVTQLSDIKLRMQRDLVQ